MVLFFPLSGCLVIYLLRLLYLFSHTFTGTLRFLSIHRLGSYSITFCPIHETGWLGERWALLYSIKEQRDVKKRAAWYPMDLDCLRWLLLYSAYLSRDRHCSSSTPSILQSNCVHLGKVREEKARKMKRKFVYPKLNPGLNHVLDWLPRIDPRPFSFFFFLRLHRDCSELITRRNYYLENTQEVKAERD